jgi:epoxide hydrolase 4
VFLKQQANNSTLQLRVNENKSKGSLERNSRSLAKLHATIRFCYPMGRNYILLTLATHLVQASDPYWQSVYLPSTRTNLSCLFAGQTLNSDAPTILFLHGFPEGSYTWWPVISTGLLDNYTLIAPDMPGYNLSYTQGSSDSAYLVPAIASVIIELITTHLGGQVDLVAHDWGGAIAWWLVAIGKSYVRSLTILNMAHPMGWIEGVRTVEGQQRASAYVLSFIQPGFSNYLTADSSSVLQSWFEGEAWFSGQLKTALVQTWNLPNTVDAGLGWYRANIHPHCPLNCTVWQCFQQGVSGTFDEMPNNGSVIIPVRVLWGEKDDAFDMSFQLAYMATKVSPSTNLNITQYPNASHWIAQEIPETVATEIRAFILTM